MPEPRPLGGCGPHLRDNFFAQRYFKRVWLDAYDITPR